MKPIIALFDFFFFGSLCFNLWIISGYDKKTTPDVTLFIISITGLFGIPITLILHMITSKIRIHIISSKFLFCVSYSRFVAIITMLLSGSKMHPGIIILLFEVIGVGLWSLVRIKNLEM